MLFSNAFFLAIMIMETIASIFLPFDVEKASCGGQGKQREAMKVVLWAGEGLTSLLEEKEHHPGVFPLFHGQSWKASEIPCKPAREKHEEPNFIKNPCTAIKESELNSPVSGCDHSQTSHNDTSSCFLQQLTQKQAKPGFHFCVVQWYQYVHLQCYYTWLLLLFTFQSLKRLLVTWNR